MLKTDLYSAIKSEDSEAIKSIISRRNFSQIFQIMCTCESHNKRHRIISCEPRNAGATCQVFCQCRIIVVALRPNWLFPNSCVR